MNAWLEQLHYIFIEEGYYSLMLQGLKNTAIITLGALLIGVAIGTVIALIKFFAEDVPALKPFAVLCDLYVTVIRGVPVVVLLLIFYFIILQSSEGTIVGYPDLRYQLRRLHGRADPQRHQRRG